METENSDPSADSAQFQEKPKESVNAEDNPQSGMEIENSDPSAVLHFPDAVKVCIIGSGKTNKTHREFFSTLSTRIKTQKKCCSVDESDIVLVFCPIFSRAGTNVETALKRFDESTAFKLNVLVVLHHTFSPEKTVPDSSTCVNRKDILTVDCLFYEDTGLLKCQKNDDAMDKVVNWLIETGKRRNVNVDPCDKSHLMGFSNLLQKQFFSKDKGKSQSEEPVQREKSTPSADQSSAGGLLSKFTSYFTGSQQPQTTAENRSSPEGEVKSKAEGNRKQSTQENEIAELIEKLKSFITEKVTKIKHLEEQKETLLTERNKLIQEKDNILLESKQTIEVKDKELDTSKHQLETLRNELQRLKKQLDEQNTKLIHQDKILQDHKQQQQQYDEKVKDLHSEVERLKNELSKHMAEFNEKCKHLENTEKLLTERDAQIKYLEKSKKALEEKDRLLNNSNVKLLQISREVEDKQREIEEKNKLMSEKERLLENTVKDPDTSKHQLDTEK